LSADLYRAYAHECLHFASGMETPSCKAVLLQMANAWLRLAQQAEKNDGHQPVTIEDKNELRGDALLDPPATVTANSRLVTVTPQHQTKCDTQWECRSNPWLPE